MLTELFEIQCREGCSCYAENLDSLERVLEYWRPAFVSIRSVTLDPFTLAEAESGGLICGRKQWDPACQRKSKFRLTRSYE